MKPLRPSPYDCRKQVEIQDGVCHFPLRTYADGNVTCGNEINADSAWWRDHKLVCEECAKNAPPDELC